MRFDRSTGASWFVLVAALTAACNDATTAGGSPPRDAVSMDDASSTLDALDAARDTPGGSDRPATDAAPGDAPRPTDSPTADAPDAHDAPAADVARDTGDPGAVVGLAVDPNPATLRVTSPMTPQMQAFVARGTTRDGRVVAVPALWSVDRPEVLSINAAGVATTTSTTGGDVVVTARQGTLAATATVRVVLDFGVAAPGAPTGVEGAFPAGATPGTDTARLPTWVYPANETVFPQNVYKVLFQWRRGGSDRFRVTFESDRTRVSVFTDGANAACTMAGTGLGCFEPTQDIWRYVAGSNPRGSVRVTVDGASASAPGTFYRSSTLSIGFSRGPVPGAIYYWSTTVQGVRRATVSDAAPTNFLTPAQADRQCVACHTLSRRGNRMAADVGGNNLWVVEVSPAAPPPRIVTMGPDRRDIPMFWSTFSTDETRVLTAARGVMTLRRTADGSVINAVPLAARSFGTQPDWAPDDSRVAFVLSGADRDRGVSGGRIATVDILPTNAWGAPRTLAGTGMNNDTNQFPSFSWNSRWIAWTHSTGNGQNDVTSDLWLMRADGSGARSLTRANTVVNNGAVTTPTIQDNMPTWAPSGVPDDYAWIAFSSTRDYGGVLSGASRLGRHEQLWVAAISLDEGGAADPSHPAFRLPFQGLDEDNHRPFWALDRVGPTCAAAGSPCATSADCCAPSVCRDGVCGVSCAPVDARCATSADCCAPSVCITGACRPPCRPVGGACASNADCCAPTTCVAGSCTPAPCRAAGTACTGDADCCSPGSCLSGMCTPPTCRAVGAACTGDADCCRPATCRGGLCRAPCVASGATCATDTDCCAPNTCRGGMCRPPCSASGGVCVTSADCCSPAACVGGVCRPPCVATGAACASDTDCCSPNVCRSGVCGAPCRATATACTTAAECCSGVCTRGSCAPPPCRVSGGSCASNADCCSGACVSGGCAPG